MNDKRSEAIKWAKSMVDGCTQPHTNPIYNICTVFLEEIEERTRVEVRFANAMMQLDQVHQQLIFAEDDLNRALKSLENLLLK